ncbi:unnamed protein product [Closterium sp. NIES-64]|nr:unnamed protein product [Closterium sp. NIES-64]
MAESGADVETATFESLGICSQLVEACQTLGWKNPTPIQCSAIPPAIQGRDVIGLAQTGSGKTAAFTIPILEALLAKPSPLFACILSPTRELAIQIAEQCEALGSSIGLKCAVVSWPFPLLPALSSSPSPPRPLLLALSSSLDSGRRGHGSSGDCAGKAATHHCTALWSLSYRNAVMWFRVVHCGATQCDTARCVSKLLHAVKALLHSASPSVARPGHFTLDPYIMCSAHITLCLPYTPCVSLSLFHLLCVSSPPLPLLVHGQVGTPGRLVDHLSNTKGFNLRTLKYLVRSFEADQLLNSEFEAEIDEIPSVVPKEEARLQADSTLLPADRLLNLEFEAEIDEILKVVPKETLSRRLITPPPFPPHPLLPCFFQVLDEADRLLNLEFEAEIDEILKVVPKERRTLLFSATMTSKVAKLQRACLKDPVKVEVSSKYSTVDTLRQQYLFVPAKHKDCYLVYVLNELAGSTAMVFTRTCDATRRVALLLRNLGFPAIPISGQMSQPKRLGALNKFKSGDRSILICTDVASRGLDIPSVDMVVNYDIPTNSKDYIHRVGRTARAGRSGRAITIVTQYDVELFQRIEQLIGKKMEGFPAEAEEALVLLERVSEAQRLANMTIRDKDANRKGGRRRTRDDDEEGGGGGGSMMRQLGIGGRGRGRGGGRGGGGRGGGGKRMKR